MAVFQQKLSIQVVKFQADLTIAASRNLNLRRLHHRYAAQCLLCQQNGSSIVHRIQLAEQLCQSLCNDDIQILRLEVLDHDMLTFHSTNTHRKVLQAMEICS